VIRLETGATAAAAAGGGGGSTGGGGGAASLMERVDIRLTSAAGAGDATALPGFTLTLADRTSAPLAADASAAAVREALLGLLGERCEWAESEGQEHWKLQTFEGGAGGADDWAARNGNDPQVVSDQAFCGRRSLAMLDHGTAASGGGWGRMFETTRTGYGTAEFPFLCMAYRIPPGTVANMLVRVMDAATSKESWKSVLLTQGLEGATETYYPAVASWGVDRNGDASPVQADGAWHYTCTNLHEQLDAALGNALERRVTALIWHDQFSSTSGYTTAGSFWVDEFSVSKHARSVSKVSALGGAVSDVAVVSSQLHDAYFAGNPHLVLPGTALALQTLDGGFIGASDDGVSVDHAEQPHWWHVEGVGAGSQVCTGPLSTPFSAPLL
jgi:hypothetical protein